MIVYFDTSALVPLIIEERASESSGELWDAADSLVAARITYVEAVAAMAAAERIGRISERQFIAGRGAFDDLWSQLHVVEIGPDLVRTAADLARTHGLRGYDATHCAAAISVDDPELVAASGDQQLLAAWRNEGLATRDTATWSTSPSGASTRGRGD